MGHLLRAFTVLLLFGALLGGCAPATTSEPPTLVTSGTEVGERELVPVTVGMGYVPNVQFAPFYLAIEKGYFADEGLDVTLDYGMENDVVQLVGTNKLQFAAASGDQVLLARSMGLPVVYVATWYERFPTALASLTLDLSDPKVLEGQSLGLPGLFGANYIGWLAFAHATGLDAEAVKLESVGFNQVPVLIEDRVDAIVGYGNNEPVLLEALGYENVSVAEVSDVIDLVANGIITNEQTIEDNPEVVQGLVRGFLRGLQDTLENPDDAFDIVVAKYVPEAEGESQEIQREVLERTLEYWRSERLGYSKPQAWEASYQFLRAAGLLENEVDVTQAFTNRFVENS